MSLSRLRDWDREDGRGAVYQVGLGVIEVRGRLRGREVEGRDESFDFRGPNQRWSCTVVVASAERAYEELIFRDRYIPGGLRRDRDGAMVFETHDPDGVRILFREMEIGD